MINKKNFVKEKLKWGYLMDITPYYKNVFKPYMSDWIFSNKKALEYIDTIEILNRDVRGINYPNWDSYLKKLKINDMYFTAHDSFMKNDFYNPLKEKSDIDANEFFSNKDIYKDKNLINFFWYVVPSYCSEKIPVFEKSVEDGFRNIDFAKKYGADRITIHVTKPGFILDKNDFEKYMKKWRELDEYGNQNELKVLVETGGISIEQLNKLYKEGAYFNLDTSHAFLDNLNSNKIYELFKDKIKEVHLSMTKNNKDSHESIDYIGEGYSPELRKINSEIIKKISELQEKENDVRLILETVPSEEDIDFFYTILKGGLNE